MRSLLEGCVITGVGDCVWAWISLLIQGVNMSFLQMGLMCVCDCSGFSGRSMHLLFFSWERPKAMKWSRTLWLLLSHPIPSPCLVLCLPFVFGKALAKE